MKKEKKMPKEYAAIVSLTIFFTLVTVVGGIRLYFILSDSSNNIDIDNISVIEENTNLGLTRINLSLKNSLSKRFDVDIYYGNNINVSSVNAINLTDSEKVFAMLRDVNDVLNKYPNDLIKEIEKDGYTISIYLVDSFTNNIEALANRNSIGQFNIYLSNTADIQRALHHEIYHILEYYIKLQTIERFSLWAKYNPNGFEYTNDVSKITSKYVYNGQSGAYFVTLYAKYSDKEDRAETFAEMMTANRMELFFNEGEYIKSKINFISSVLRNTFRTVRLEDNLAWE